MTSRLDATMRFHQTALNLRAYRQQVIASNIANADTPNFKARDLDFQQALKGALGGAPANLPLATTSGRHLPGVDPRDRPQTHRRGFAGGGHARMMPRGGQRPDLDSSVVCWRRRFPTVPAHDRRRSGVDVAERVTGIEPA